ncbi:uncharacterized protein JN550_012822 [Neoarthrinium moseri]|uniref:uncharacterized protein n=1 Tax=Neoarthrinium moseri TaxID=1658444 RepID=UPI001FDB061C|nr:uncharacterized protein JN550_012822 [Neoarthrinium moseri]KAI1858291.1 hypothetical protein JN550_012822 [Neoarthrinium moseri]
MQIYEEPELQNLHKATFVQGRPSLEQVLPHGISREVFEVVVEAFASIVGRANVATGEDLLNFTDPFTPNNKFTPSAAVCPKNIVEIQAVLEIASKHSIPLWTCSRGKNLGYGGAAPRLKGSVVLSLYRMSRILEVNEKQAYAVVEPGVTFWDLSHYCLEKAPSLWASVPFISWGSVLGNTLDRGFGYNALGCHHENICGLEAVLANGDVVRTGQWAAEGAPTGPVSRQSFGPSVEGLFLQSNLGIVTKLAIWLQPRPETYMNVVVHAKDFDDIDGLLEAIAQLRRDDIIQNDPLLSNIILNALNLGMKRNEFQNSNGTLGEEAIEKIKEKYGLAYWACNFDFYGTKEMIMARLRRSREVILKLCPTARLEHELFEGEVGKPLDPKAIESVTVKGEAVGVATVWKAGMINFALPNDGSGHGAHCDFAPLLPHDGKFVKEWLTTAMSLFTEHGFDFLLGGHVFRRHFTAIHQSMYNSDDEEQVRRVDLLMDALDEKSREYRLTNYRAHLRQMDAFQDHYNFNSHAYKRLIQTIKHLIPREFCLPASKEFGPKEKTGFNTSSKMGSERPVIGTLSGIVVRS